MRQTVLLSGGQMQTKFSGQLTGTYVVCTLELVADPYLSYLDIRKLDKLK